MSQTKTLELNAWLWDQCLRVERPYPIDHVLFDGDTMKKLQKLAWASSLTLLMLSGNSAQADNAADKLGRGLAGIGCGFLELPGNIVKETRARGIAGLPNGFAKGIGMIVTRELVGIYELVSAPIPVPEDYKPVLQPEYPWSYFD
jgi:putative exosortase-associated protein (TIGR04073 family)